MATTPHSSRRSSAGDCAHPAGAVWGGQSYREYAPPPGLESYVACLWAQRVAADGLEYRHLSVPNGSAEIVCDLATGAIRVSGPQTAPRRGSLPPGQVIVGARLRPGAVQPLLGLPASEIVDRQLDVADCVLPADWRPAESTAAAGSPAEALSRLARELTRRAALAPSPATDLAVVERLQPWSRCTVAGLTGELFLSERQFRRRCRAAFGFGPKELQRILRFQALLALLHGRARADIALARLARLAGYADQSHLTRECVRLTGLTPTSFLAELSLSCGANHDHTASFARARRLLARA